MAVSSEHKCEPDGSIQGGTFLVILKLVTNHSALLNQVAYLCSDFVNSLVSCTLHFCSQPAAYITYCYKY